MKDKKEKQMFSDERTKFIYIDFVVISAILAFISIRGEYVHAILWAVVELIVTPFIVRKGVRLQLMLFTIFTIFAITVAGVSINKMFKTAQASSTAVVSESVSEEMSSMNAELERLKKESEKQSERESVQESLDAYYTAEYPGETPTETLEDVTESAQETETNQPNETQETTTKEFDGKIPTSRMIYTGSDLFWTATDDYYGHVLKTTLNEITIELANGDVVVQPRKSIMQADLYGYNPNNIDQ